MIIKILGSGCKNCVSLKDYTELALKEAGIEAEIVKVEGYQDIVSFGKVLKQKDIVKFLEKSKQQRRCTYD